jgi:hypothetical protein
MSGGGQLISPLHLVDEGFTSDDSSEEDNPLNDEFSRRKDLFLKDKMESSVDFYSARNFELRKQIPFDEKHRQNKGRYKGQDVDGGPKVSYSNGIASCTISTPEDLEDLQEKRVCSRSLISSF